MLNSLIANSIALKGLLSLRFERLGALGEVQAARELRVAPVFEGHEGRVAGEVLRAKDPLRHRRGLRGHQVVAP